MLEEYDLEAQAKEVLQDGSGSTVGNKGWGRPEERRSSVRKVYVTRVLVLLPDGKLFEGKTFDVSEQGLSLLAPFNLPANIKCKMRFELITAQSKQLCEVDAVVNYSVCQSQGFKVGMQFTLVSSPNQTAIRQFLNSKQR
ncbi:PilZ domain-containing protein [Leeia oryzae]|uniref:PilZ domain-containing protein n=1 Tax=Leeia oryzae TaxID=356662 RepID=UPI0003680FF9|nr:PilZ domain-containing protein [Leeia oryzae]